ncbi:Os02g0492650 [Oryza sativa Japonica Group]|uniref:Os02g0492650 protein n=2 Tax=Oryza sativa subsp. japonica TaxID=39947 RepID=Q6K5N8_ORYSJ|nr:hypothetical protein [Oryza sativa Japonica Group]BAS78751.1 Os02g0492650 [Oryza sativa Japonica Group]
MYAEFNTPSTSSTWHRDCHYLHQIKVQIESFLTPHVSVFPCNYYDLASMSLHDNNDHASLLVSHSTISNGSQQPSPTPQRLMLTGCFRGGSSTAVTGGNHKGLRRNDLFIVVSLHNK